MAHRLAREVEAELGNIWCYIAKQSGNIDVADRLIDSIIVLCGPSFQPSLLQTCHHEPAAAGEGSAFA